METLEKDKFYLEMQTVKPFFNFQFFYKTCALCSNETNHFMCIFDFFLAVSLKKKNFKILKLRTDQLFR